MSQAKKILVALDLSSEAQQVLDKAVELAGARHASLSLIHVIEPVITDSNFVLPDVYIDLEATLIERANAFLKEKASNVNSIDTDYCVELGSVKSSIFQKVEDEGYELIVMGTHGRHGLGRLLGSTASAVLHGTPCDVYMVRIH
ncbi:MAG: universal stress protein [Gammaproteobacteria bacterium]|nr:universal stress protein [Gammaproteobacteria bacterium]